MEIKGFLIAVMLLFVSAASVWAYKKAPFAKSLRKLGLPEVVWVIYVVE